MPAAPKCIDAMDFSFLTVGKVIFGSGRVHDIGAEAASLGSRVLLVAGRGFARRSGLLSELQGLLAEESLEVVVFDEVPPEPSLSVVDLGIEKARSAGCDVVVAIGGGSALDVGKAVAGLAHAPGTVGEYFRGREVESKGLPFIAIPTTAGSGAEVTSNAVLSDQADGVKASIRSPYLYADVAIVDPDLTLSLPPQITAQSGMDALCQAIEACVSRGATPLTDALAEDASVRLILNLPLVYAHGDDLESRTQVALGSLMGGMAFANARLGLVHGLAHPLGVATGLPHGLICGLLLPAVIRLNAEVSAVKYAEIARMAGIADASGSDKAAALELAGTIERLNAEMGLTAHLPGLRLSADKWPGIIAQALPSGSTKSNPRQVSSEDIEAILGGL